MSWVQSQDVYPKQKKAHFKRSGVVTAVAQVRPQAQELPHAAVENKNKTRFVNLAEPTALFFGAK